MSNSIELINRVEELEAELLKLKEELVRVQDEPEIPDFPEFNYRDIVYEMDSCFDVVQEEHGGGTGDKDFTGDDAMFYNNFHTEDYANEFRRNCLLIAMLLHCKWHLDRGYVPNWDDIRELKWDVHYNSEKNEFQCGIWTHTTTSGVYFSSGEIAKKCADWMNTHWHD